MYLSLTKIFIYILIFFCFISDFDANSSNQSTLYSKKNISNYFAGIISSNDNANKLTYFSLTDTSLTDSSLIDIARNNQNLTSIDINCNDLTDNGINCQTDTDTEVFVQFIAYI